MAKIKRQSKPNPIAQKLAIVVALGLYMFIAFVVGLAASQTDYFAENITLVKLGLEDAPHEKKYPTEYYESIKTWIDDPEKAHDKLLLTSAAYRENPALLLVDRDGNIRHQWDVATDFINEEVIKWHQIEDPAKGGTNSIDDAILFPNGDVIAIQDNRMISNYRGQRLFRMDKDSNILWQIIGEFHHEIDMGADGNIYALDYELRDSYPIIDLHTKQQVKFLVDTILKVTPEGKVLDTIAVPDAFVDTPYDLYLYGFQLDVPTVQEFTFPYQETKAFDPQHTNSVQYLDARLASLLPFAQEGDLLISLRGPSAIAVLRPSTRKIVWATVGPWRHQHNVRLLPTGIIRIFDNEGASVFVDNEDGEAEKVFKSRILDYNPNTAKTSVRYFDPNYYDTWSFWRGSHHELEDGSLLYTSTAQSRVLQISPEGKVVWELRGIGDRDYEGAAYRQRIVIAKPYDKDYPQFLSEPTDAPTGTQPKE